jgi:UDPglucose 6-dehydrogenase
MRIVVVGAGYVGLVSGSCLADLGLDVTCVDQDRDKIKNLNLGHIPIHESQLAQVVRRAISAERLTFTDDLADALKGAEVALIAVGTPTIIGGDHADLSYVFEAVRNVSVVAPAGTLIVVKSTVPVGTARKLQHLVEEVRPGAGIEIASNPEFLREGNAVVDFMAPDRIVIGVSSTIAKKKLQQLYEPLTAKGVPLVCASSESAELIKYASNSYLAMRIGFVNQLTDICEAVGADIEDVTRGTGLDKRIGEHYFKPGPCYGGSCFPKDTRALAATAQDFDTPLTIIEEVINANDRRRNSIASRVAAAMGKDVKDKRIAVLGIAFKAGTDDLRDAPSLVMIPALQIMGASIAICDEVAMENAKTLFRGVEWFQNPIEAARGADAVVVLTEWQQFKDVDLAAMAKAMRRPILIDMRNIYAPNKVAEAGLTYHSLGRRAVGPLVAKHSRG